MTWCPGLPAPVTLLRGSRAGMEARVAGVARMQARVALVAV